MPINQKPIYQQSTSKLRRLWEIAGRLISQYEDFDRRLLTAEEKMNALSKKLTATIESQ